MIPKITDTQRGILAKLGSGWQIGVGSGPDSRAWLQEGGAGRGGKTQDILHADLRALFNQRLIYLSRRSFPTSTWDITDSGVAFLEGRWTDEIHKKVAAMLSEDGSPVTVSPPEMKLAPLEHPSYGQISVNHTSGGGDESLYGATVSHGERVSLEIAHSKINRRDDGTEDHYQTKQIVQVEMTHDQFVSLIFNTNRGEGTPCTIRWLDGEQIKVLPFTSRRAAASRHFEETIQSALSNAESLQKEAQRILKTPGPLKAADKNYLLDILNKASMEVISNVPFIERQFQEQVDSTLTEVNAQLEAKSRQLGIQNQTKLLQ